MRRYTWRIDPKVAHGRTSLRPVTFEEIYCAKNVSPALSWMVLIPELFDLLAGTGPLGDLARSLGNLADPKSTDPLPRFGSDALARQVNDGPPHEARI